MSFDCEHVMFVMQPDSCLTVHAFERMICIQATASLTAAMAAAAVADAVCILLSIGIVT